MRLTGTQTTIQEAARRFTRDRLAPYADAWDASSSCPSDMHQQLGEMGFLGLLVSGSDGGSEAGHLANCIVTEEIAAGSGGISTMMHVHAFSTLAMAENGSTEQKSRYLADMLKGSVVGAFCLTEPQAGSDTAMIRTRAEKVDGGWSIRGTKCYITNGQRAHLAIVLAVTDPDAGKKGVTAFLVPTDTDGFNVTRIEEKMGQRCSDTAEIALDHCVVPDANVFGRLNGGYAFAMSSLAAGRIGVAAQALGMARSAYEAALVYARQRPAFGKPIVEHQAIAFRLADMLSQLEVARQYIYHVAMLLDEGVECTTQASIAKAFVSEMAERVCSAAVSVLGGAGYMKGSVVERLYRDVRVCQIYEGTSDIQRLIISRDLDLAGAH